MTKDTKKTYHFTTEELAELKPTQNIMDYLDLSLLNLEKAMKMYIFTKVYKRLGLDPKLQKASYDVMAGTLTVEDTIVTPETPSLIIPK